VQQIVSVSLDYLLEIALVGVPVYDNA